MSDADRPDKLAILHAARAKADLLMEERWRPSIGRRAMADILYAQFEQAVVDSGGKADHPAIERHAEILRTLYLTMAVIIDQCPEWEEDGVSYDRAGDVLNEWLDKALKALRQISQAHA